LDSDLERLSASMYRHCLTPADLPEGYHIGKVRRVRVCGVETLTLLAEITGLARPLRLSDQDRAWLVRASGSVVYSDRVWATGGRACAAIWRAAGGVVGPEGSCRSWRSPAIWLAILVGMLVVLAVVLVEQQAIWGPWLEQLLAALRQR
jgi:hypothetical protein